MPPAKSLTEMSDEERRVALAGSPEDVAGLLLDAADAGQADAQLLAGQLYLDGRGVKRDPAEALRRFGLAAKGGNVMAMNMVGRCCEHGWGTIADASLAVQWYAAAAERGLDWGMYNLATLYALGTGVAEDKAEALDLFRRAAAMGHAKSLNMVGSFYEDGWVVEQDLVNARELYRLSAEAGDFRGQFNHARMLISMGRNYEAQGWLAKVPQTATSPFIDKCRSWLAEHAPIMSI